MPRSKNGVGPCNERVTKAVAAVKDGMSQPESTSLSRDTSFNKRFY